jgi:hypothetical protein
MDSVINDDYDFYGYKTFYNGIGVSGYLKLSGDFLHNNEMTPE